MVVPLNRPVIGSLALITILTSWNTYLWPRAVTIKTEWQTLQLVLRQVSVQQPDQINVGVAAAIIIPGSPPCAPWKSCSAYARVIFSGELM